MKFPEAIGAPLFNGNGWANTSLIQSEPFKHVQTLHSFLRCNSTENDDKSTKYTLPTDQLFNLEFQFKSVFNLEFQPEFGIQLGIPILMEINLGECSAAIIAIAGMQCI